MFEVIVLGFSFAATIIAALASFILGWLWYGPFFGKIWSHENGFEGETKMSFLPLFYHFLTTLVMVFCASLLYLNSISDFLALAIIIWAGFFLCTKLSSMIWMKQSWSIFWIDVSYHIINLVLVFYTLSLFY